MELKNTVRTRTSIVENALSRFFVLRATPNNVERAFRVFDGDLHDIRHKPAVFRRTADRDILPVQIQQVVEFLIVNFKVGSGRLCAERSGIRSDWGHAARQLVTNPVENVTDDKWHQPLFAVIAEHSVRLTTRGLAIHEQRAVYAIEQTIDKPRGHDVVDVGIELGRCKNSIELEKMALGVGQALLIRLNGPARRGTLDA